MCFNRFKNQTSSVYQVSRRTIQNISSYAYQVTEGGRSGVADDADGDGAASRDGETLQVATLHAAVHGNHAHVALVAKCDRRNDWKKLFSLKSFFV